jgi:hypothetical protein
VLPVYCPTQIITTRKQNASQHLVKRKKLQTSSVPRSLDCNSMRYQNTLQTFRKTSLHKYGGIVYLPIIQRLAEKFRHSCQEISKILRHVVMLDNKLSTFRCIVMPPSSVSSSSTSLSHFHGQIHETP